MRLPLIFFLTFLLGLLQSEASEETSHVRARIESCPGCSLNRLPEVKKFIFEDVPKYDNVEFKKNPGAPPELVLLNESDEEVDRLSLGHLSRKECNELLVKKGFHLKPDARLDL